MADRSARVDLDLRRLRAGGAARGSARARRSVHRTRAVRAALPLAAFDDLVLGGHDVCLRDLSSSAAELVRHGILSSDLVVGVGRGSRAALRGAHPVRNARRARRRLAPISIRAPRALGARRRASRSRASRATSPTSARRRSSSASWSSTWRAPRRTAAERAEWTELGGLRDARSTRAARSRLRCSTPTPRSQSGCAVRQLHAEPRRVDPGAARARARSAACRTAATTARPARRW